MHRACTQYNAFISKQEITLHIKRGCQRGGEELRLYEFATIKLSSALYKKEAANSMIKVLFFFFEYNFISSNLSARLSGSPANDCYSF